MYSYTQEGPEYIINKLKTPNFFGLVVASKDVIEEPHASRKIGVVFILDDEEVYSEDFTANIYRPYVSFVKSPKSVIITDKTKHKQPLEIALKLHGFGRIEIRNEISTGGEFVERSEPLYRAIVRRMISTFKLDDVKADRKGITISPVYLQRKAKEYIEKIEKGVFPLDIEKEYLEDFRNWVTEENNRTKVTELISRHMENLLVDSLLFYFEQYPADNVLMPQGVPVMFIERATRRVRIRFRYKDAMLNEYKPIEIAVNIDDRREDRTRPMGLPINIKWILETINPLQECE